MTEPSEPGPEPGHEPEPRRRRSAYDVGGSSSAADPAAPPAPPRPMLERIGMAAIALVLAVLFGFVGVAAFLGGELFLAVMGFIGAFMVLWVGGLTLFRGR